MVVGDKLQEVLVELKWHWKLPMDLRHKADVSCQWADSSSKGWYMTCRSTSTSTHPYISIYLVNYVQELQENGCKATGLMSRSLVGPMCEPVSKCLPFFLDQSFEAIDGAIVRIKQDLRHTHYLHCWHWAMMFVQYHHVNYQKYCINIVWTFSTFPSEILKYVNLCSMVIKILRKYSSKCYNSESRSLT